MVIKKILIVVVVVVAFFVFLEFSKNRTQSPIPPVSNESLTPVPDNKAITMDSLLSELGEMVGWESNEYSRSTILWNTKEGGLKLDGVGYGMGAELGDKKMAEHYANVKIYLRDLGFEVDKYNAGSSSPIHQQDNMNLNGIGCQLELIDREIKGGTDFGIYCTQLPESVVNLEPEKMSEKKARSMAETGNCAVEGSMKETASYNENSKTWWIDMDVEKPGCNPACVVSEDETSEINWRCTGLISD